MIGASTCPGCELCKRERKTDSDATDVLVETVAHLQTAGCKAQKKSWSKMHAWSERYVVMYASQLPAAGTLSEAMLLHRGHLAKLLC